MNSGLLSYALLSALCLSLLYAAWLLLLRRETFFRLNRQCIVAMVLLSLFLPTLNITMPICDTALQEMVGQQTAHQMAVYVSSYRSAPPRLDWLATATHIYIIGVVLMLAYNLLGIYQIERSIRRNSLWKTHEQGTVVYCHAGNGPSYSWFRRIAISETDYEQHPEVLIHEQAHVYYWHSIDNLLLMFCRCLQWFNPTVFLLGKSLSDIHEYEADAYVLERGTDMAGYQLLLVDKASGHPQTFNPIVNGFAYKRLKRRIAMMQQQPSDWWHEAKVLLLFPIAFIAFATVIHYDIVHEQGPVPTTEKTKTRFATPYDQRPSTTVAKKRQATAPISNEAREEPVLPVSDPSKMAQFPGGNVALRTYLSSHLPQFAESGMVMVSFVVGADGRLGNIQILQGHSEEANQAVLALIHGMPRWIPGRKKGQTIATNYTLPIYF